MSSSRLRFLEALLVATASVWADAQMRPPQPPNPPGRPVSNGEATCRPTPVLVRPECSVQFQAYRIDYLAGWDDYPGEEVRIEQGRLECDTCEHCCINPLPPPTHCQLDLQVCDTRTFTWSLAGGLEVGLHPRVKAMAEGQFGYNRETSRCWSVQAGCECPPCTRSAYTAELTKICNRRYRVVSEYRWKTTVQCDTWSWNPGPPSETWATCSQTRVSYVTGTEWRGARVKVINLPPCPPPGNPGSP